jgi:hypothetical protein
MEKQQPNVKEYGDHLFIEEQPDIVLLAELFNTLPVRYEHYRKHYAIAGRASRMSVLVSASMDPERTIVLERKIKKGVLAAGVSASDCSSVATLR